MNLTRLKKGSVICYQYPAISPVSPAGVDCGTYLGRHQGQLIVADITTTVGQKKPVRYYVNPTQVVEVKK